MCLFWCVVHVHVCGVYVPRCVYMFMLVKCVRLHDHIPQTPPQTPHRQREKERERKEKENRISIYIYTYIYKTKKEKKRICIHTYIYIYKTKKDEHKHTCASIAGFQSES